MIVSLWCMGEVFFPIFFTSLHCLCFQFYNTSNCQELFDYVTILSHLQKFEAYDLKGNVVAGDKNKEVKCG